MQILYNNPIFRVINNGWISKICKMGRGIRQECPISALLYLFVADILAIKIKENRNIEDISFKNSEIEVRSVQHADDLTVSVKNIRNITNCRYILQPCRLLDKYFKNRMPVTWQSLN